MLELISNLPIRNGAVRIADAYRQRWKIETGFAAVEKLFQGELPTLAAPGAALLSISLSLIAWSSIGVLKAGLRREHGQEEVTERHFLSFQQADAEPARGRVFRGRSATGSPV